MKKVIIAVCKWIIAKLSEQCAMHRNDVQFGKRRLPNKTMVNYPKGIKRRTRHRGCWVHMPHLTSYYPTQQAAADAIAKSFNLDIYRHDVYNALYHKDGELYYGNKYLCKLTYDKDV